MYVCICVYVRKCACMWKCLYVVDICIYRCAHSLTHPLFALADRLAWVLYYKMGKLRQARELLKVLCTVFLSLFFLSICVSLCICVLSVSSVSSSSLFFFSFSFSWCIFFSLRLSPSLTFLCGYFCSLKESEEAREKSLDKEPASPAAVLHSLSELLLKLGACACVCERE